MSRATEIVCDEELNREGSCINDEWLSIVAVLGACAPRRRTASRLHSCLSDESGFRKPDRPAERHSADSSSGDIKLSVEAAGSGVVLLQGVNVPPNITVGVLRQKVFHSIGSNTVDRTELWPLRLFLGQGGPELLWSQNAQRIDSLHIRSGDVLSTVSGQC